MKIKRTKTGAEISLTAKDVDSAVMQFVCSCHPEFARGYSISTLNTGTLTVEALLAQVRTTEEINDIGVPGWQGFGVGVCPGPLPAGMAGIGAFNSPESDTYGNYIFTDGSVMVWVPAFYYKLYKISSEIDIKPYSGFQDVVEANAAGYALPRAFYDGGQVQPGVFVDKFLCSNNKGVASSLKNGNPLSTYNSHNPVNGLNGSPENAYFGTISAAKTRGDDFFVNSRFIFSALALLSLVHAGASLDTTCCGWYHDEYPFPKGCNNWNLGDHHDSEIRYESDGYSNCGKTGSANLFSRTTHNGQNCGIADLNGCMWEVTPGLTSDGKNLYILKTDARMKDLTAGMAAATDLWGSKGIKRNYEILDATGDYTLPSGYFSYGSRLNVLSGDTTGIGWQLTGSGIALPGDSKNSRLSGGFWNYPDKSMCPISGGGWYGGSGAGVWAFYLYGVRGSSGNFVGFRSALYL